MYYLICLGDTDNSHRRNMMQRLYKLGNIKQILDNVFVYEENLEKQNKYDFEKLRNYLAGSDYGYCLVIELNKNFKSAWSLTKDNSAFLTKIFKNIHNE